MGQNIYRNLVRYNRDRYNQNWQYVQSTVVYSQSPFSSDDSKSLNEKYFLQDFSIISQTNSQVTFWDQWTQSLKKIKWNKIKNKRLCTTSGRYAIKGILS